MDVYLPIANLSVNGLVIVALGALTGILSGLFGVGGGFLIALVLISAVRELLGSRTLLGFNKPGTVVDQESIMAAVVSFCTIFGGSLLIGAFYGVASALCFKKLDMRHHGELIFMQSALSFAFPWAAYFTSEALELSGIVTILFCGMIMAVYTRYSFHEEARLLTAQGYKCVAVVAENKDVRFDRAHAVVEQQDRGDVMEGGNNRGVRQNRCRLLRGGSFVDGQRKRPLLVEAQRVHAIHNDLACEIGSEGFEELSVAIPRHRHDDDVAKPRCVLVAATSNIRADLRCDRLRTIRCSRTDHHRLPSPRETLRKAASLFTCATENADVHRVNVR